MPEAALVDHQKLLAGRRLEAALLGDSVAQFHKPVLRHGARWQRPRNAPGLPPPPPRNPHERVHLKRKRERETHRERDGRRTSRTA